MHELNRKVALDFIESMSTNNRVLAEACLGPDARAVAKGFGHFAGIRHREVMIGTIDAFMAIIPTGLRLTVKTVTAEGDRVIIECEGDAVTSEGKAYQNQYCFVITLADGKITLINEYFCNVHANEVLWPLIAAMGESLAAS
jgi:hypothetical protein